MLNKSIFSSGKDDWQTPDHIFKIYDDIYHFRIDLAANEVNHKCLEWLGPGGLHEDALSISWKPYLMEGNAWLNPPYSRILQKKFIEKAVFEAMNQDNGCIVTLLPARTDTKLFHNYIWNKDNAEVYFLSGRIKFKGAKNGAPFPSMIVVFS